MVFTSPFSYIGISTFIHMYVSVNIWKEHVMNLYLVGEEIIKISVTIWKEHYELIFCSETHNENQSNVTFSQMFLNGIDLEPQSDKCRLSILYREIFHSLA